jgi:alanyl-tRNA synthetase
VTKRLYYDDAYIREFEANVVALCQINGAFAVMLDATAFYPTGGGQPHDRGTLASARVVDVLVDDQGDLWHILDRALDLAQPETRVRGEIDWTRRFDHMQQHTGQHILSQAFMQVSETTTIGFRLGEQLSTIDLDQAHLSPQAVGEAEKRANEVVLGCSNVIARFVDKDELARMPLRKMPAVEGPIRIVEVTGFDWSPCGGTHVQNTGQIGPIKVVRIEHRKKQTRIHFCCGWRALSDYDGKHEIVQQLAAHLTTGETEIVASVQRLEAEAKALRKELTAAQLQALDIEIAAWTVQSERIGQINVVRRAFDQREESLLKEAARRLVEHPRTIALLGSLQPRGPGSGPQFVFARSEDLADHSPPLDMSDLMRAACAAVRGRGGGRPSFAQGGAPEGASVDKVLDQAVQQLEST